MCHKLCLANKKQKVKTYFIFLKYYDLCRAKDRWKNTDSESQQGISMFTQNIKYHHENHTILKKTKEPNRYKSKASCKIKFFDDSFININELLKKNPYTQT